MVDMQMTAARREEAMCPRRLSEEFGGVKTEAEIRAMTRRRDDPLPCIANGEKRPHVKVYPSVFAAYLMYGQGVAEYGEVEQAARRCVMGARA